MPNYGFIRKSYLGLGEKLATEVFPGVHSQLNDSRAKMARILRQCGMLFSRNTNF